MITEVNVIIMITEVNVIIIMIISFNITNLKYRMKIKRK